MPRCIMRLSRGTTTRGAVSLIISGECRVGLLAHLERHFLPRLIVPHERSRRVSKVGHVGRRPTRLKRGAFCFTCLDRLMPAVPRSTWGFAVPLVCYLVISSSRVVGRRSFGLLANTCVQRLGDGHRADRLFAVHCRVVAAGTAWACQVREIRLTAGLGGPDGVGFGVCVFGSCAASKDNVVVTLLGGGDEEDCSTGQALRMQVTKVACWFGRDESFMLRMWRGGQLVHRDETATVMPSHQQAARSAYRPPKTSQSPTLSPCSDHCGTCRSL